MKGITKDWHLVLDAVYVPAVFAAPKAIGFTENGPASALCKGVSVGVLSYALLTDAKGSLAKVIPYKTHALLDFASGMLALAAPLIFGFAGNKKATATFLAMGVTGLVVGTLSYIASLQEEDRMAAEEIGVYH